MSRCTPSSTTSSATSARTSAGVASTRRWSTGSPAPPATPATPTTTSGTTTPGSGRPPTRSSTPGPSRRWRASAPPSSVTSRRPPWPGSSPRPTATSASVGRPWRTAYDSTSSCSTSVASPAVRRTRGMPSGGDRALGTSWVAGTSGGVGALGGGVERDEAVAQGVQELDAAQRLGARHDEEEIDLVADLTQLLLAAELAGPVVEVEDLMRLVGGGPLAPERVERAQVAIDRDRPEGR